ncbi:MAG: hypothetical protein KDI71_20120, partial [Xanthomonadales bacterium]|nr:hypothetical protein [Xanthomonadales bacterium]
MLSEFDQLGDFEAQIEADWNAETQSMRERGIPAVVVDRQVELLAEVRARAAQFRTRIAALRAEVARSSVSGTSSELIELADWLDPQQHARGYQAIEAAQLPLQLADAERTPAPGAVPTSDADKVAAAKAFTDPPTPADLAPTLDAPFTPAIQALAAELNNDPVAIRSWVYNNIEFQPTFGSIQGADLTLLNRSGNAHDIASLTIALLRSAGTPARYVKSVVELPVEQVQNWLGDLATPQMALDLLQKGGVPAGAVIVASRIKAIQFEHVWVEAYVDFIPSRARLNRVPDQWVPLDVAFKQYDYQPAVPWRQMSLNARQNAVVDFANQLTLDGTGGLSGFDFDRFDRSITNIAEQLAVDLPAAYPGMDVEDFYDQREIHQIDSLIIAGTLPFPLRSATVLRYSELPANARHVLSVKFYADQTSLNYDSPTRQVTIETVRLGTQRLQADYAPATPADAQAIAQYVSDNATTIPLGQLSVVPRLRLGDELLFQSGNGRMGQLHFWKTDTRDVHGNQTSTEAYRFPAGSQIVFVANLAGMSGARVEREHQGLPDFGRFAMADGLYYGGTLYWMMHDNLDDQAARSVGGRALRIPSVGSFATNLQVRYFFGVPRTGFTTGQITDVKAVGLALALPNAEDLAPTALHIGAAGSMSESASWALLAGTGGIGLGASTATLLKAAMDEGQRLFQIKQSNVDVALAELQLSADAENEIRSAVAGGLIVVAHEREVQYRNWSGAGYVIYSPTTGASLQRIEGGFAGGLEFGCIARAVALELLCSSKILAIAQRFLLGFAARLAGRALALAGLGALFAAVAPAAAVILPILSAVVTIISIAMAVAEVIKWVRGIIDGSETLTEDELIQLGIDSINELACSYGPPCLPFAGEALNALGIGGPTQSTEDERGMGGPTVGNPVAVGTGAKWQVERDFDGAGPFPLHFVRTYISQVPKSGGLIGVKWSASYFQSVKLPPSIEGGPYPVEERPDRVLLRRPDGSYYQFDWRTDAYVADANIPGTLERLTSGTNTAAWEYTTPQDTVEHYDAQGRLQYIRHRAGLTHTVSHDEYQRPIKVTDSYGRELNFTYSEETAYLETMTDPVGRVTHYQHDEFGNLTQVRYQDDSTRTYHYEDLSNRFGLTGITDERNIRVSTWAYDHKGRVLSYHRAGDVDQHTFEYAKNQTTVTDPLGTVRTYEYESIFDRPYIKQVTQPCSVCGAGDVSETTYDSRGLIATRKDFRNAETRYTRNSRGLVESMTEAVGTPVSRITRTQWHPDYYLPTRMEDPITGGSRVTEFFYDGEGNLTDKTVTTPEEVRQWSFTYNANGQRTGADGPRSDVVDTMAYTYHPDGTLATRVDAVGNQWDYTDYDADGQLRRMVDPNGLVTTYRYDDRQRLTEINEDNEITAFGYDAAGNLTRITLPDSSYIEYVFDDAERISEVRDNLGHRLVYQLDGQGNRMVEERFDRNGNLLQTMRRVYDGIGRLKEHYGAEDQLTEYGYDPNNNQTSVRDPNQLLTQHRYDPLNRLDQTINPLLGEIEFAYDAQDNLTQVSDPRDVTTTYAYNGFDELTRLTSPDTGITDYDYDPAGNLLSRTDARGVEATYQYDAENRLTQIDYPAHNGQPAETLSFSYDDSSNGNSGRGRLTAISDGSGNTRFTYDSHGRVTAKTQTVGGGSARTLQTSYLANGRLEGHVLPSGAVCRYSYRADGRVLSISVNGVEIVSEIDYFAFGEIRSWDYGNSGQYRREFDQDGRIREHSAGSASRSIGFDPASRITAIADNSGARHNWSFDYDDLDRL